MPYTVICVLTCPLLFRRETDLCTMKHYLTYTTTKKVNYKYILNDCKYIHEHANMHKKYKLYKKLHPICDSWPKVTFIWIDIFWMGMLINKRLANDQTQNIHKMHIIKYACTLIHQSWAKITETFFPLYMCAQCMLTHLQKYKYKELFITA